MKRLIVKWPLTYTTSQKFGTASHALFIYFSIFTTFYTAFAPQFATPRYFWRVENVLPLFLHHCFLRLHEFWPLRDLKWDTVHITKLTGDTIKTKNDARARQTRYRTEKSVRPPDVPGIKSALAKLAKLSRKVEWRTPPIQNNNNKQPSLCFRNLPMTLPTLALSTVRVTTGGRRSDSAASRNIRRPASRAGGPPSSPPVCRKTSRLRAAPSTLGTAKVLRPWNAVSLWYWPCPVRHDWGGGLCMASPCSSYSSSQSDIFNMAANLPVRKFVKLTVRSLCTRKSEFPTSGNFLIDFIYTNRFK